MSESPFEPALLNRLRTARQVVALTGAGTSAESGVPTFRESQTGLWAQYDPAELATPEAFQRNPQLVWDWYQQRRRKALSVQPNPGHTALAELAKRIPGFRLITQNVDGLHQRAGSDRVIELHGNLLRAKCFQQHHPAEPYPEEPGHPVCAICGSLLRPDVVWFHESLPAEAIAAAELLAADCDLFFSIGTSSLVYPAAALAQHAAQQGACVVEINPQPTPLTPVADFALPFPAGVILPKLVAALA